MDEGRDQAISAVKPMLLLFFIIASFFFKSHVYANSSESYVTIVHPVRGKSFWQSTQSVKKQIDLITKHNLPATWLLQYSLLNDDSSLELFKKLPENQEIGVFLEVDEHLATDSLAPYLFGEGFWARADMILLSGYEPSERKRMIDAIFKKFKEKFGGYPASVGAWYIDTISLNYMVDKYQIKAMLDVADQYDTDSYGLWGKPWGAPYIPSKFNSLIPSKDHSDRLEVVKIQWAQRDPVKGYGLTPKESTYSLQANDYIEQKLDTKYFKKLLVSYLSPINPLNQVTIGLEAGQEGRGYFDEYQRQIETLLDISKKEKLNFTTMESFAKYFKNKSPSASSNFFIMGEDYHIPNVFAYWYSTPYYRIGLIYQENSLIIRDLRFYPEIYLFTDIYKKDHKHTLQRIIPAKIDDLTGHNRKILVSEIKKIDFQKKEEKILINIQTVNNGKHQIILESKDIIFDNKVLFSFSHQSVIKNFFKRSIANFLIFYRVKIPHNWNWSWRFSFVNNKYYFGLMTEPNRLVGFQSEFPYLGSFRYPFQVLTRFKTLPSNIWLEFISKNLVKMINHSKIN